MRLSNTKLVHYWKNHLNSQILNLVYPLCAIHPSILFNASERIKVSDLINLCEDGFQVIRISPSDKLVVKKITILQNRGLSYLLSESMPERKFPVGEIMQQRYYTY